jgi:hypothetical protein
MKIDITELAETMLSSEECKDRCFSILTLYLESEDESDLLEYAVQCGLMKSTDSDEQKEK